MHAEQTVTDFQIDRDDPRHLVNIHFQIKILFSSDNPRMLGRKFSCSTIDISKSGIQIKSLQPLAVNSVLDLSIMLDGSTREFLVTGNVKWCKHSTGVSHAVGIQLKSRSGTPTDLDDWKKLIKHIK